MGVLLMPRAAAASPLPFQTSDWYSRNQTQLPGGRLSSLGTTSKLRLCWLRWLSGVDRPRRSTCPGHPGHVTIRGPRTQSLLQNTSVELDVMTLSGFTRRIICHYWTVPS